MSAMLVNVQIKSNSGATVKCLESKLDSHKKETPYDAIIVHAGMNNISNGKNSEDIMREFGQLTTKIQEKLKPKHNYVKEEH